MDGILGSLTAFAITGALSAPYIVGFRDPEDFNPMGVVWMFVGVAVFALTGAYSSGLQTGAHSAWMEVANKLPNDVILPMLDESESRENANMIGLIGITQSVALLIFQSLYIDPKLRKKREAERDQE